MKRILSGLGIECLRKLDCAFLSRAQLLLEGETLEPLDTLHRRFPPAFSPRAGHPWREAFAQLREGLPHSLLNRLDGDLKRARNLGVLEAALATQLKDFPAILRKSFYRITYRTLELDTKDLFFRGRRAWRVEGRNGGFARNDSLVSNMIERPIAGGSYEIGAKSLFNYERFAAAPQLEHDILRYLLGECALANDRLRHSHEVRIVRPENGIEGALVPGPDALPQIPLARVVCVQVG